MRWVLAIIGLILIVFALFKAYELAHEPLAVISVGSEVVEVYPSGGALSVLGITADRGVVLRFSNGSTIKVVGHGVVPIEIGGSSISLIFDSRGKFLSLSVEGNASVGTVRSTEEFSKAVLTYTVAPFVSGFAFTLGSLMIKEVRRRRE